VLSRWLPRNGSHVSSFPPFLWASTPPRILFFPRFCYELSIPKSFVLPGHLLVVSDRVSVATMVRRPAGRETDRTTLPPPHPPGISLLCSCDFFPVSFAFPTSSWFDLHTATGLHRYALALLHHAVNRSHSRQDFTFFLPTLRLPAATYGFFFPPFGASHRHDKPIPRPSSFRSPFFLDIFFPSWFLIPFSVCILHFFPREGPRAALLRGGQQITPFSFPIEGIKSTSSTLSVFSLVFYDLHLVTLWLPPSELKNEEASRVDGIVYLFFPPDHPLLTTPTFTSPLSNVFAAVVESSLMVVVPFSFTAC